MAQSILFDTFNFFPLFFYCWHYWAQAKSTAAAETYWTLWISIHLIVFSLSFSLSEAHIQQRLTGALSFFCLLALWIQEEVCVCVCINSAAIAKMLWWYTHWVLMEMIPSAVWVPHCLTACLAFAHLHLIITPVTARWLPFCDTFLLF